MSFYKLKEGLKKSLDGMKKSAQERGNELSYRRQLDKDIQYTKEMILDRFEIRWLKNMCRYYKIGVPEPTEYNFKTGNKVKVRVTKEHWIDHCSDELNLDQIKEYAKSHKIKIADIEREEVELTQNRMNEYNRRAAEITGEEIPLIEVKPECSHISFMQQIVESIDEFEPARDYAEEKHYQFELNGWLKKDFPSTDIEVHKGHSRPDIVIDNVAIEIKGPTNAHDLDTIFGKGYRYLQDYDHMIVALFDVRVDESLYRNWETNITEHYPDIVVIRK